ncbi:MAG: hypothetical protein VX938_06815, partial [Myxococcota bacterium]|nr:hypothetical protein [Myxococcota bacterium]
ELGATQCHPCTNHEDCNQSVDAKLNRCVSHDGAGSYCATRCGPEGATCPSGSSCQELSGDQGGTIQVCMPDSGECSCSPWAVANSLSTPCSVSNDAGSCEGSRTCLPGGLSQCLAPAPTTEVCNGVDDDCDGEIDEGVISPCGTCSTSCAFETTKKGDDFLSPTQNPFGGAVSDVLSNTHPVIWIANSEENTATRMNTDSGCEEARYAVCGSPSRTAVDKDGNGFIACRSDGKVAKIAIESKDCIDANGNGVIDTSQDLNGDCQISSNEMVANDECILWTKTPTSSSCARAGGVDSDGNLWVGAFNIKQVIKLNGQTGETMISHTISGAPYGLAIGTDQTIWVASRDNASLLRVDPELGQTGQWTNPVGNCYGIAIDPYGKIWVAGGEGSGGGGVGRFDPDTEQWTTFNGLAPGYTRGVAVKLIYGADLTLSTAKVYVAHHTYGSCPGNGEHRKVSVIDALTLQVEPSIDIGADRGPVGVG